MTQTMKTAPEIKAVPETMTAAFEDFMGAFEAFKETNDRRLGEIEQKLTADVVTRDKVDRINRAMDEHKRVLDGLALPGLDRLLGGAAGQPAWTVAQRDDGEDCSLSPPHERAQARRLG